MTGAGVGGRQKTKAGAAKGKAAKKVVVVKEESSDEDEWEVECVVTHKI